MILPDILCCLQGQTLIPGFYKVKSLDSSIDSEGNDENKSDECFTPDVKRNELKNSKSEDQTESTPQMVSDYERIRISKMKQRQAMLMFVYKYF